MDFFKTISKSLILGITIIVYTHTSAAAVTIEQTNFSDKQTVQPTSEIKLKLDRLPSQNEGRLSIFIGQTDVTSMFRTVGNELIYQPKNIPLPVGETKVIVYLVKENNQWQEIAQLPLKVSELAVKPTDSQVTQAPTQQQPTQQRSQRGPSQSTESTPSEEPTTNNQQPTNNPAQPNSQENNTLLRPTLTLESQFLEARSGEINSRPTSTELTFKGDFNPQERIGDLDIRGVFSLFGTTIEENAIRFQQQGENARNLDLEKYDIDLAYGSTTFSLGHNTYGNHRFLLNNISNRGLLLNSRLSDRFDITLATTTATDIVGFDNIFGLNDLDNDNISAAIVGYQIVKGNPDNDSRGVRLEATLMTASRQPEPDFNQLQVVDAEDSDGFGLTLVAEDSSGRLRFNGGFARSTFTNPSSERDSELTEGLDIVPVVPATENAYFLEAEYDLVKNVNLGSDRILNLTLKATHERIDPLFNSIGASVAPDTLQTVILLEGIIAGANLTLIQNWNEDNLADISTTPKNNRRNTAFNLNLPLQTVFAVQNPLLPTLSYSFTRNRNFTANSPEPVNLLSSDLLTTTHTFGTAWKIQNLTFGYNFSSTFSDNRRISGAAEVDGQPDQQPEDTQDFTNEIKVGWQATPGLRLDLGYQWTSSRSLVTNITQFSSIPTLGIMWQIDPSMMLIVDFSRNENTDSINRAFVRGDTMNVILGKTFIIPGPAGLELPANVSLQYGLTSNSDRDRELNQSRDGTIHTLTGNISISF
ncbi:hypothetical protein [Tolypothrix sp. VBCCA 56010]|uniref:hypothetical protein n=1 Tax=Tolypothrix sp. VBCCA 56010 TaxID=3137731 RepID=UPI003D7E5C6B